MIIKIAKASNPMISIFLFSYRWFGCGYDMLEILPLLKDEFQL